MFGGYEHTFPSGILIYGHVGYRIHTVSDPTGKWTMSDEFGVIESGGGTLQEYVDEAVGIQTTNVSLDYNGAFVRAGFGLQFRMGG